MWRRRASQRINDRIQTSNHIKVMWAIKEMSFSIDKVELNTLGSKLESVLMITDRY